MFRSELLNLNTYNLNVSGAKTPAFTDTSEFIDATDLEEVSGKKSGNWVLSFLKEHLALSIAAGIVLLLGILTLIALLFFYRKGKKVKNEMKTWMSDLQIYNNYGPNVYKTVTAYAINDDTWYRLDIDDYIDDFADNVIVLTNIYNKAKSKLDDSSSMDLQEKKSLQLIMLAAAKELEYISREVMSKTKYNFFKSRIQRLHLNGYVSIVAVWEELGINADSTFTEDIHCKYLVQAIVIELNAYQFMLNNNLQLLNNQVNESSTRIDILQDLGPLSLNREVMDDFIYKSDFPVIEDIPMSNIKLGWNACFKSGNEIFGYVERRFYMLFLIRSRIIDLLSSTNSSQTVLDNKQLLVNLLRQCKTTLDCYLKEDNFSLSPEIKEKFTNYVKSNSDNLTCDGFIAYCNLEPESITSQMKENIRYRIADMILGQKTKKLELSYGNTQPTEITLLGELLLNENLMEQLNFDRDDREDIRTLFANTKSF